MKKLILTLLLSSTFFYAISCDCSPYKKITEKEYKEVDAVFVGHIISIDPITDAAQFIITESLKQNLNVGDTIVIHTPHSSCGFVFELHHEWYIWAHNKDGKLFSSMCNRSNRITKYDTPRHLIFFRYYRWKIRINDNRRIRKEKKFINKYNSKQ